MASEIKQDLILSGFVPTVEKCKWVPVQSIQFLGANTNSKECHLTVSEARVEKALKGLTDIEADLKSKGKVFVKKVASFVGQIISISIVIGHVSLIMTKSLSVDICKASTCFSMIILSDESKEQLKIWQQNIRYLNCKRMFGANRCSKIIYRDASSSGYAGFQVSTINKVVHGMWSPDETVKSSTWRELSAVYRVLRSLVVTIKNSKVKWYSDNAAVCFEGINENAFTANCVRYILKE